MSTIPVYVHPRAIEIVTQHAYIAMFFSDMDNK